MFGRIATIAFNTYREAVRARVLHGMFALALATGAYVLVVAAFAVKNHTRVVSDLGAASISLYGIVVAVVLGATSLYRELELKTLFPILARPIRRWEYLVGKYLGTLLTLFVFIVANTGALLLALSNLSGKPLSLSLGLGLGSVGLAALIGYKWARFRTAMPLPCAIALVVIGFWLSREAPDDRRVLLASTLLTLCEVGIVAAIATVFASFSSPFLTAIFTFGVFVVGRSADTLAKLPVRVFGETLKDIGAGLSRVVPNLMLYVPERPLLTGEAVGVSLVQHTLLAALHAVAWSVGLLAFAALVFRRRDFL